ncbi:quinone oxidoreductase [Bosea sp. Root483D1]|uniref:quinone oxidoreductase family protein n=1 Tax=Bosea sp. Root483D1 TaxID=1736544 RepID=UPI00070907AC|nr:quinone oxidoreductase [Bosea sp. Root483D1]KRE24496.1 quinone oxidoreductase [Bosea sp. Root483D1]
MTAAILLSEYGGPERLELRQVALAEPGPGELRLRQTAVGVNFHDVYVRSGLYRTLALPGIPGIEASGVVEGLGAGVEGFAVGDRVCYVTGSYGAYAAERNLPAALALKLPAEVGDEVAAATILKGLTACMLLRREYRVGPGDFVLVHAAAGGVGQLLCRWARHLGATVIATVGDTSKEAVARACGAQHVITGAMGDLPERVRQITAGQGVAVAYDSVGRDSFQASLASLAWFGRLVNFGQSSGPVPPFEVSQLAARSNALSRPIVFHYLRDPARLHQMADEVFALLGQGILAVEIGLRLPLAEAGRAHALLEARQTMGPTILLP